MRQFHTIPPFFPEKAKILILGSFPSVLSRSTGFYYGNPQNRFWRLISALAGEETPADVPAKKAFLTRRGIALWDVAESCEIDGSSDASIRGAKANPISEMTERLPLRALFINGRTAARLFEKLVPDKPPLPARILPSTSAANASRSFDMLLADWAEVRSYL